MFQTRVVQRIKTHIVDSVKLTWGQKQSWLPKHSV